MSIARNKRINSMRYAIVSNDLYILHITLCQIVGKCNSCAKHIRINKPTHINIQVFLDVFTPE